MAYPIREQLLPVGMNRPGTWLNPVGVIIHETATPGATADAEARYFAGGDRGASAHYFVDDITIIRITPENEVAWHAGPTANRQFLSIELCHFADPAQFEETWKRAVWLAADMCRRYGWDPDQAIHSHAWVSRTYRETDHTDPYDYFQAHGKTMDDFIADVKKELIPVSESKLTNFPDVPAGHWAEGFISAVTQAGIMKGYPDGMFRPDQPVTRAELAAVVNHLLYEIRQGR